MKEALLALLAGIMVGVVFKVLRLPLPAPPVLAGILGIVGIYIGGMIVTWIAKTYLS
jgi:XapX domain-containing protein